MVKKTIQICDLTKLEYDPDETVRIVIKAKGKTGRSYDLSPDSAAKIEQQLVAGSDAALNKDWNFTKESAVRHQGRETRNDASPENINEEKETDDEDFVAKKKAQLRATIGDLEGEVRTLPKLKEGASTNKCIHMNRSGVQIEEKDGIKHAFTICRDPVCGIRLPIKKVKESKQYLSAKAPAGTREGLRGQ